ncbi:unnamed protein product [Didymodactylos carnosus]|uniref:STI1/HOP DP domain-containing protein n=1 Tax=Didymodactylos carnosus TaxID=1234261 RepID=A0A815FHL8_9BILA|nr:unnamed protein product [Didymodactylos carnosus]CAF4174632.1 unnamed protein product [Didymodactylos carnosus]
MNTMFDENDIPPLEDIPNLPEKPPSNETTVTKSSTSLTKTVTDNPTKPNIDNGCFGGLKKGFLSSTTEKTKPPLTTNKLDVITKTKENKKDFRVFDEVQQALKKDQLANGNWLTEDLLDQIQQDAFLEKRFNEPYFMEAINLFQKKPEEALKRYGSNKDVMEFFQRMAKVLGSHFTSLPTNDDLSPEQDVVKTSSQFNIIKRKETKPPLADPEVNKLLENEQVRKLLLDPDVVSLMKTLREEPDKAQWLLRTADAKLQTKIKQLVDFGLLSVI